MEAPPSELSETHEILAQHSKFISDNFEILYSELGLLKDSMEIAKVRLRKDSNDKFQAHDNKYVGQIGSLEIQTEIQSLNLDHQQSQGKLRCSKIEQLRNQVGVLFFRSC